jgi:choline dehydrogenase-like flavoprotein
VDDMTSCDVAIIGSGFGGTMTALTLAQRLQDKNPKILMLERGTWWTTPVSTVQDKGVATYDFLKTKHQQPVQFWSSVEHFKGIIDIFLRCTRRKKNEDGLYDLTFFGKRGLFGFGGESDGVTVGRASGVGGGSLIYSNITVRPPDFIFDDPRWPLTWSADERNFYFNLARHAIGYGVVSAWTENATGNIPYKNATGKDPVPKGAVNAGLSNIATRSARLTPNWEILHDSKDGREIKRIKIDDAPNAPKPADQNRYWIDRARIFQTAMRALTKDFGTVDSSINDITPEGSALDPVDAHNYPGAPINYCERQGRCNVGCLPGARHTLNKQLMRAIFGKPDGTAGPQFANLQLQALAEVNVISSLPEGGYEIQYWQRDYDRPWRKVEKKIRAKKVIVAAGCLGTNEIMLRSKEQKTLPNLSDQVGFGFSTNGDYIAFLEDVKQLVSLTRGPVTTCYAHFNTPESAPNPDPLKFHIVEDQGIPRALASTVGFGVPLLRSLSKGRDQQPRLLVVWSILLWFWHRCVHYVRAFFRNYRERQDVFESEDELVANMMCIVAQGREASVGQFRLGTGTGESPLRLKRIDGKAFHQDPIYDSIRATLDRLATQLGSDKKFINPFLTETSDALEGKSIALTHPLGGCRIANNAADGVADEFGRVFDNTKKGDRPFYEGLYLADAAVMPTALGVNPSLTISALALRIADKIVKDW